jgi:hypothetical protein
VKRATVLSLGLLVLASCSNRVKSRGCREDRDCGSPVSAYRCEPQTGECFCRTNQACPPAQFCNLSGFCQDRSGCTRNSECLDPTLFCDTLTNTCFAKGRCTSDLHCPQGNVCDFSKGTCVEGCRGTGDCPGSSCRCQEEPCRCTATTEADLKKCPIGVCDPDFCSDDSFCRFGERCGARPDSGITRNQCFNDFDADRRPYCGRCLSGGGIDTCGVGANFCIIDTRSHSNYCGVDCSEGQTCPRGYGCRDIRVVYSQSRCDASRPCQPNFALPCQQDSDCKRGGQCIKTGGAAGFCAGRCRLREGSNFGFCSCQVDFDCALESCTQGKCSISQKACITKDDCRPIHCVDFDGVGGCLIGQNCTPNNGLTCIEVGH